MYVGYVRYSICIQLKCMTVNSKMNAKTSKECSWVAVAPSPRFNTVTSTHKLTFPEIYYITEIVRNVLF